MAGTGKRECLWSSMSDFWVGGGGGDPGPLGGPEGRRWRSRDVCGWLICSREGGGRTNILNA